MNMVKKKKKKKKWRWWRGGKVDKNPSHPDHSKAILALSITTGLDIRMDRFLFKGTKHLQVARQRQAHRGKIVVHWKYFPMNRTRTGSNSRLRSGLQEDELSITPPPYLTWIFRLVSPATTSMTPTPLPSELIPMVKQDYEYKRRQGARSKRLYHSFWIIPVATTE